MNASTIFNGYHGRACAVALAAGLALSPFLTANAAACANGNPPPCPAHRDPGPNHSHAPYLANSHAPRTGYTQPAHQPSTFTAAKKPTVGPVSPGPTHAGANPSNTASQHGIIFVGGHQPSAGSKAALNPQPIPPGHPVSGSMLASHPQAAAAPKPAPTDPHSH